MVGLNPKKLDFTFGCIQKTESILCSGTNVGANLVFALQTTIVFEPMSEGEGTYTHCRTQDLRITKWITYFSRIPN